MDNCAYDAEKHEYRRNGVLLPSVTGIIHAVWPRTDGAPEDAIEKARLRGTFVDEKFMEYLTSGTVTIPAGTPQEYADCLGQAVNWWDAERKGAKVQCQVQLFGEREAGTADIVVSGHEIIDLKSTYDISKTVPAQLGGYGDLMDEATPLDADVEPRIVGVLHVHRRLKQAKFVRINYLDALTQWNICRSFFRLVNGK